MMILQVVFMFGFVVCDFYVVVLLDYISLHHYLLTSPNCRVVQIIKSRVDLLTVFFLPLEEVSSTEVISYGNPG